VTVDSEDGLHHEPVRQEDKLRDAVEREAAATRLVAFKGQAEDVSMRGNIDADFEDSVTNLDTAESVKLVEDNPVRGGRSRYTILAELEVSFRTSSSITASDEVGRGSTISTGMRRTCC